MAIADYCLEETEAQRDTDTGGRQEFLRRGEEGRTVRVPTFKIVFVTPDSYRVNISTNNMSTLKDIHSEWAVTPVFEC